MTRAAASEGTGSSGEGRAFLFRRLRAIWPILLLSGFGGGLLQPNLTYLGLNFFAREHTSLSREDIHCELTPTAAYCRAAVAENTAWFSLLGSIAGLVRFLTAPAVGGLSDAYGRRPVLVALSAVALLPGFACVLNVFCGLSLYWVFALSLLSDLPAIAVFLAVCVDLLAAHPACRAAAFGLVAAAAGVSVLLGLLTGAQMELRCAVAAAMAADSCSFLVVLLLLPETLPTGQRRPLHRAALLPGTGMAILLRDGLFRSLSLCVVVPAFVDTGIRQVAGGFLQATMDWTRKLTIDMASVVQVSSALWLGVGMHAVTGRCGELGALSLAFTASATWCLGVPQCTGPGQVLLLSAIFAGPSALSFPAISALKSRLADEHEQGELQGALHAASSAAQVAGRACFGGLFSQLLARGGADADGRASAGLVFTAGAGIMAAPIAVAGCCLPRLLRQRFRGVPLLEKA